LHRHSAVVFVVVAACSARQTPPVEPEPSSAVPAASIAPSLPVSAAPSDAALAQALGNGIVAACQPRAGEAELGARQRCADGLTAFVALRDSLRDPVLWGAQAPGAGYELQKSRTTQMNALVLRRMYLSTFAFGPDFRVDETPTGAVLHVASRFHYELDPGDYPYPFWHSPDKWKSYERTRELLFVIERGSVAAVLRSEEQDPERPHVDHAWDGQWRWQSARGEEPQNALYASLFSAGNPHVAALDAAYRTFEREQRQTRCLSCHDPSNVAKANPLELFSYPNQALTGRHDIVRELRANEMPPASVDTPAGIADEAYRQKLLGLAERFAELGDEALRYDGERVP
jgi:hypothetical protein